MYLHLIKIRSFRFGILRLGVHFESFEDKTR